MIEYTKENKDWLEREIIKIFEEEDYDGHVSSLSINQHNQDWLEVRMNSHDRFGSEVISAYVNTNTGEVNGDLTDSFNQSLMKRIKDKS